MADDGDVPDLARLELRHGLASWRLRPASRENAWPWRSRSVPPGTVDAAEIAETFLEAHADAMPYLPRLRHTDDEVRGWIRDVVLPGDEVVVAEVDGKRLAGFAALDEDLLDHIYVHPELQGRGIGDALLARVKERPGGFRPGSSSATRAPGASTSGAACASSS